MNRGLMRYFRALLCHGHSLGDVINGILLSLSTTIISNGYYPDLIFEKFPKEHINLSR